MEQKKDYNLLRPFDLEAAKRGEPFVFIECGELKPRKYIAGPGLDGSIVVKDERGNFGVSHTMPYNMAPLCWVEGRPVYKGDVLYRRAQGRVTADHISRDSDDVFLHYLEGGDSWIEGPDLLSSDLTWTPPKVKREGWVNIYQSQLEGIVAYVSFAYASKDAADAVAAPGRIACIRIEWEE